MANQRSPGEHGDRVPCEVVLRRPEPSGDEDRLRARGSQLERLDDPLEVVSDGLAMQHVDPDRREPLRHPPRVRVGDLSEQ
jgi:hypothetical protein